MAYLTQDNVLQQLQGGQPQVQDPTSAAPQTPGMSGAGGGSFVGGGSTQQARGGLQSPWTNIDSYFKANEGQLGTGVQAVQQQAQGVLQGEKEKLQQAGTQAKGAIQKEQGEMVGKDAASQMIAQQNQQGSAQMKGFLGGKFDAPQYQYAQGAKAQEYAKGFKDPNAFQGMRENSYRDITGRELTTGQKALQSQFDSLSGLLDSTREQGAKDYSGFEADIAKQAADIGTEAVGAESKYKAEQDALRAMLQEQSGGLDTSLRTQANALNQQNRDIAAQYEAAQRANQDQWSKAYGSLGDFYLDTMSRPAIGSGGTRPYTSQAQFESDLTQFLRGDKQQSRQSKQKMEDVLSKAGVDKNELMRSYSLDRGSEFGVGDTDQSKVAQFNYIADILGQSGITGGKGKKASFTQSRRGDLIRESK